MKKRNLVLGMFAIAALSFTSCSDDDNSVNDQTVIAGTYNLTEVNTQGATDFDKNGTSNVNQMKESSCYDDNKITLNSDGTLTYVVNSIIVNQTTGVAACGEDTVTGTWEKEGTGSDITIRVTYTQNGTNTTINLDKDGDKLTYTKSGLTATYPDRNADGSAYYRSGSTEYVFVR